MLMLTKCSYKDRLKVKEKTTEWAKKNGESGDTGNIRRKTQNEDTSKYNNETRLPKRMSNTDPTKAGCDQFLFLYKTHILLFIKYILVKVLLVIEERKDQHNKGPSWS